MSSFLESLSSKLRRYAKQFFAHLVFVVTTVAVVAPIIVGTGTALIWLGIEKLALVGWMLPVYFAVGFFLWMFQFAVLRRAILAWGTVVHYLLLGREPESGRRVHH
ncbi:hypothetical protein [Haladaptatus sp. DFWS20]|uniref:hypothetical protein n=1 Tax=Haladaptatus sp. DFWS20 TaxID=3403467 RepID=UPI003EBECAE3